MNLGPNQTALVKALRETDIPQCTEGCLAYGQSMCALGVGLLAATGVDARDGNGTEQNYRLIRETFAITDLNSFYYMNDDGKLPFPQIADAIEANPSYFFNEPR